jgi:integrase
MRLGALLDLIWRDVNLMKGASVITVRGETAKDRDVRLVPVSTRLAGFLEMAKTGPEGKEYAPERFVFGELGEPLGSIKRAWETAVLKARGVKPEVGRCPPAAVSICGASTSTFTTFGEKRARGGMKAGSSCTKCTTS